MAHLTRQALKLWLALIVEKVELFAVFNRLFLLLLAASILQVDYLHIILKVADHIRDCYANPWRGCTGLRGQRILSARPLKTDHQLY